MYAVVIVELLHHFERGGFLELKVHFEVHDDLGEVSRQSRGFSIEEGRSAAH